MDYSDCDVIMPVKAIKTAGKACQSCFVYDVAADAINQNENAIPFGAALMMWSILNATVGLHNALRGRMFNDMEFYLKF